MNLYQQELLDHYHHSPFKGVLSDADFSSQEYNPSCGDRVSISVRMSNGVVEQIAFEGAGCVISQAAASLLCQASMGRTLDQIKALDADFMLNLVRIPLGPTRLKCALLSLQALHQGIVSYTCRENHA